jgi:hypothetical protein
MATFTSLFSPWDVSKLPSCSYAAKEGVSSSNCDTCFSFLSVAVQCTAFCNVWCSSSDWLTTMLLLPDVITSQVPILCIISVVVMTISRKKLNRKIFWKIFQKIFPFIRTVDMVSLFTFYTVIIMLIYTSHFILIGRWTKCCSNRHHSLNT